MIEEAAGTHRRPRGRPRTQPSWRDENGLSHALYRHPNYQACKEVLRRVPELVCDEWLLLPQFVFGVEAVIGSRSSTRDRLERLHSAQDFSPESVLWVPLSVRRKQRRVLTDLGWGGRRNMQWSLQPRTREEDFALRLILWRDQRLTGGQCDCTRLALCHDHERGQLVDEEPEPGEGSC